MTHLTVIKHFQTPDEERITIDLTGEPLTSEPLTSEPLTSEKPDVEEQATSDAKLTPLVLANRLKLTAPAQAVGCYINGQLKDFDTELKSGDIVAFADFEQCKELFWHSSAHILAQAVLRLYPKAQPTIGPAIDHGFYYDFAGLEISENDLKAIEKEMIKIVKEELQPQRIELSYEEAIHRYGTNPYKAQILQDLKNQGANAFSGYIQGEFDDLCRGPHLSKLSKVKSIKLLRLSGAYWRGKSENEMLTRIYGVSFPSKELMSAHMTRLQEAKERDHKLLGPKLDLFSFHEQAPGIPFFHPKGLRLFEKLISFWRVLHKSAGYEEIKTPQLMARSLWETSGHWQYYRENMFSTVVEKRDFAVKPMNCPGCMLYYKSKHFSYRDFPLRIGEIGCVHRYEPSGALSGLFRVRCFHQDDAHLFVLPTQIAQEVCGVLKLIETIYSTFGLTWHLELSTRPQEKTIGTDEQWEMATSGLEQALKLYGQEYKLNPGDGAFYGPKIDVHIHDAIGRSWQCATIQLDMSLPERFDLEYTTAEGKRERPVMLHRAIFGSIERFMGILIEHFKGRLPLWLSPEQVRILPIADRHITWSEKILERLNAEGFDVTLDASHESTAKKVRSAQLSQVNYMIIVGDDESSEQKVSVRTRSERQTHTLDLETFIDQLKAERASRALSSSL